MHPVYCLISLSSRYDHHKRVWYFCEASWKGANSARRHPLYSSSMYWSDFYCDSSMKQTTPKYLNGLQHSLSWFWISSLAYLAVQGCILRFGFRSGSGQLQLQAERKICCSHCGVGGGMELQAVLWKFATSLTASVQNPKDHFYPLAKELTWLSPKSMKRVIILHQLWTMAGVGKYEKLYTNSNIYHTSFYSFLWCTKTQSDDWSPAAFVDHVTLKAPS